MRSQERQIVVVRFVVVVLSVLIALVLRDRSPALVFDLGVLGAVAVYNLVILLLVGRFPAREVGVLATGLDMIAVTLVVWADQSSPDS